MAARTGHTYRTVQESAQPVSVPLGTSPQGIPLMGGMDGVVTSVAAAAHEIQNVSKELKIISDRQAMMYGSSSNSPGDLTHALTNAMRDAIDTQTQTLTRLLPQAAAGAAGAAAPGAQVGPGQQSSPYAYGLPQGQYINGQYVGSMAGLAYGYGPQGPQWGPNFAPPPTAPAAPGPAPVATPAPATPVADHPSRGRQDPGQGYAPPIHEARQDAFHHNNDFFRGGSSGGDSQFSLGGIRQALGRRVQASIAERESHQHRAQDPVLVRSSADGQWYHADDSGQPTTQQATAGEVHHFITTSAIKGAANTLSSGGTMREAGLALLPEGVAGAAGAVGAGVFAAQKVADFMQGQRAQNAQWQSMMGGTQADAYAERARSRMFQFGQMGVLSGADAAALYQGVAATGMNQSQRGVAQDFAVNNYKDLGMSIQDSMDIVNTASRTGQESLDGLATALKDVTQSAKDAGVNTEAVRQQFTETWKAFSDAVGGSSGAATAESAGFTKAISNLGRRYENVKFDATDPNYMRMVGAANGMTLDQVIAENNTPGKQAAYAQQASAYTQARLSDYLGAPALAQINKALHGRKFSDLSQSEQQVLETQVSNSNRNIDLQGLATQILPQYGLSGATTGNALGLAINAVTGNVDAGSGARQELAKNRTSKIDVGTSWLHSLLGGAADSEDYKRLAHAVDSNSHTGLFGIREPWDDSVQTSNAFLADVRKTGRVGGISQALVEKSNNGLDIAKRVRVNTPAGPKVVSLEDAMKYYRDQIDAGTAFVPKGAGTGGGESIAEAVGMQGGDRRVKVTSSKTGGGDPAMAHVTISPTPFLNRLFKFTMGGVSVDPTTGLMPPTAHVTANGRPSGSVTIAP